MQNRSMMMRLVPANFGPLKGAHASARITGPCGDTMEFWIMVQDGIIAEATFTSDGCANSVTCGSTAARLALQNTPDEACMLTQETILKAAGPVPQDSHHCALLAANTLKAAIADYRMKCANK